MSSQQLTHYWHDYIPTWQNNTRNLFRRKTMHSTTRTILDIMTFSQMNTLRTTITIWKMITEMNSLLPTKLTFSELQVLQLPIHLCIPMQLQRFRLSLPARIIFRSSKRGGYDVSTQPGRNTYLQHVYLTITNLELILTETPEAPSRSLIHSVRFVSNMQVELDEKELSEFPAFVKKVLNALNKPL